MHKNPKCCIYRFWTADSESHPFLVTGHKKEAGMGDAGTFLVLYSMALSRVAEKSQNDEGGDEKLYIQKCPGCKLQTEFAIVHF